MNDRFFRVKQRQEYSKLKKIGAGVPQGSILGPILYLLYTADIPFPKNCKIATFADDTCILSTGSNEVESSSKLQASVDKIVDWTDRWRIKLNEAKSTHIDFTYKKINHKEIKIANVTVPYSKSAKYLGITLDEKLKWLEHIGKKQSELNLKVNKLNWLIGRNSMVSIKNKLLIYNQVLKPIWTYGAQIWGCAAKNHIEIIQRIQNKILRNIVNAPWYTRTNDLHRDLGVKKVADEIKIIATKHAERLQHHTNPEASILCNGEIYFRRLKRTKPHDLVATIV